jgi:ankyrin repeat domain-containing protein 50
MQISSTIVEHMKLHCEKPGFALAYYYFDFKDTDKQEVSNFVSSLTAQLCCRLDPLPENLKELYKRCKNGQEKAAMQELKTALSETIKDLEDVFVVVDALDECPKYGKREELLDLFAEIKSWSVPHLHILATSRQEHDIEQALLPLTHLEIPIRGSGVKSDIKLHIEHQLATDPKLNEWPDDVKSEIERVLVDRANGM